VREREREIKREKESMQLERSWRMYEKERKKE
jgi:hypothetical protein